MRSETDSLLQVAHVYVAQANRNINVMREVRMPAPHRMWLNHGIVVRVFVL